ncbi:hypothetical protein RR42_s1498 [Cupriavidus basilensis]|uniref:Uncharacterized protein n=1 Tax=Cupriavidus basilensis TaxID=68895 RepID=A0A0C4YR83_9BURK|nr:hypothetical protein RR42_s1498 [Cupriavidus basilensis]
MGAPPVLGATLFRHEWQACRRYCVLCADSHAAPVAHGGKLG